MSTLNNVAKFNGRRPVIDPTDAVLLLIDHQSGLFQTVKDMEMTVLRANATILAKVATLAKIPVITSASVPQGPNGPLIPEILLEAEAEQDVQGTAAVLAENIVFEMPFALPGLPDRVEGKGKVQ